MGSIDRSLKLAAIAAALACVGGCATIVKGTTQQVTVTTDPAVALCRFDRKSSMVGVVNPTPGTIAVSKGWGELDVTCAKDGYEEAKGLMKATFQAATLGNILLGGIIGIIVDASSGAMAEYPSSIAFMLFPVEFATPEERDAHFGKQHDAVAAEAERLKGQILARCGATDCEYQTKPIDDARDAKLRELEDKRNRAKVVAVITKAM